MDRGRHTGDDPRYGGKPYRVYRATRGGRRRRRGSRLTLLLLAGIAVAGLSGVAAAAGWGPFAAGAPGAATGPSPAAGAGPSAAAADRSPLPGAAATPAAGAPSPASSPPVAQPTAPPVATVTAGGDVCGGFGVAAALSARGDAVLDGVAPWFRKSDFGFVNLESPLTDGGDPQGWKDVVIRGSPRLAPALAAAGVDVVTLANNHAGDMGDSGLLDTIRLCRRNGIAVVGAGRDLAAAVRHRVLETPDGVRVAFLGFTDVLPAGFPATADSPGTAPGRSDLAAVVRAVRAARREADYVVVGWHWNFEYRRAPGPLEVREARAAIDAGADVVFAHHPHLLNGVQAYRGGLVCYSLGNLVFSGFAGETAETVLVRVRLRPDRLDAELVPVRLAADGTPTVARGAAGEAILARVRDFSAALGTRVRLDGDRGHVLVRR